VTSFCWGGYIVIEVPIVPNRQRCEGLLHCYRENALEIQLLQEASIGLASGEGVQIAARMGSFGIALVLFELKLGGLQIDL
jgi:hypothetical protein